MTKNGVKMILNRLFKYMTGGFLAIAIDYSILYLLTEVLSIFYLLSVALSYAIAHTIYYFINRKWTFKGTTSDAKKAYILFIAFGMVSIFLTTSVVGLLTEFLHFHYFISRICASVLTGTANFLFNYFVSFNMSSEIKTESTEEEEEASFA